MLNRHIEPSFAADVAYAARWPQERVHGAFWVLQQRPDGTVLVSEDMKRVWLGMFTFSCVASLVHVFHVYAFHVCLFLAFSCVFIVQGIAQSLAGVISPHAALPVCVSCTILPFDGYWAYDGLLNFGAILLSRRRPKCPESYARLT